MSVIIRLQGLAWTASAADIRNFFKGLSIPPGGVHIIGGEQGDAFIAFTSDEDARQAMRRNNGYLCDCPVQLLLSSKTEMQTVISEARSQTISAPPEQPQQLPMVPQNQPPQQPMPPAQQPMPGQQPPQLGNRPPPNYQQYPGTYANQQTDQYNRGPAQPPGGQGYGAGYPPQAQPDYSQQPDNRVPPADSTDYNRPGSQPPYDQRMGQERNDGNQQYGMPPYGNYPPQGNERNVQARSAVPGYPPQDANQSQYPPEQQSYQPSDRRPAPPVAQGYGQQGYDNPDQPPRVGNNFRGPPPPQRPALGPDGKPIPDNGIRPASRTMSDHSSQGDVQPQSAPSDQLYQDKPPAQPRYDERYPGGQGYGDQWNNQQQQQPPQSTGYESWAAQDQQYGDWQQHPADRGMTDQRRPPLQGGPTNASMPPNQRDPAEIQSPAPQQDARQGGRLPPKDELPYGNRPPPESRYREDPAQYGYENMQSEPANGSYNRYPPSQPYGATNRPPHMGERPVPGPNQNNGQDPRFPDRPPPLQTDPNVPRNQPPPQDDPNAPRHQPPILGDPNTPQRNFPPFPDDPYAPRVQPPFQGQSNAPRGQLPFQGDPNVPRSQPPPQDPNAYNANQNYGDDWQDQQGDYDQYYDQDYEQYNYGDQSGYNESGQDDYVDPYAQNQSYGQQGQPSEAGYPPGPGPLQGPPPPGKPAPLLQTPIQDPARNASPFQGSQPPINTDRGQYPTPEQSPGPDADLRQRDATRPPPAPQNNQQFPGSGKPGQEDADFRDDRYSPRDGRRPPTDVDSRRDDDRRRSYSRDGDRERDRDRDLDRRGDRDRRRDDDSYRDRNSRSRDDRSDRDRDRDRDRRDYRSGRGHDDRDNRGRDQFGRDRDQFGRDRDQFGRDRDRDQSGRDRDRDQFGKDRDRDQSGRDTNRDRDQFGRDRDRDQFGRDRDRDQFGRDRDRDQFGRDKDQFGRDKDQFGRDRDRDNRGDRSRDEPRNTEKRNPSTQLGLLGAAPVTMKPSPVPISQPVIPTHDIPVPPEQQVDAARPPDFRGRPVDGGQQQPSYDGTVPMDFTEQDPRGVKRPLADSQPPLTVRVIDVPYRSHFRDVHAFFQGCDITYSGIKYQVDTNGKRTGVVFVKFNNPESVQKALEYSGRYLMNRYVTITICPEEDFINGLNPIPPGSRYDAQKRPRMEESKPVQQQGFPFGVPPQSALYTAPPPHTAPQPPPHTAPQPPPHSAPQLPPHTAPHPSPHTAPQPPPPMPPQATPLMTLHPTPPPTFNTAPQPASQTGNLSCFVQLNGLPMTITKEDVRRFFSRARIAKNGTAINFEYDVKGRTTGSGFVEFENANEYQKALTCDGLEMSRRRIRITPSTKKDVDDLIQRQQEILKKQPDKIATGNSNKQPEKKDMPVTSQQQKPGGTPQQTNPPAQSQKPVTTTPQHTNTLQQKPNISSQEPSAPPQKPSVPPQKPSVPPQQPSAPPPTQRPGIPAPPHSHTYASQPQRPEITQASVQKNPPTNVAAPPKQNVTTPPAAPKPNNTQQQNTPQTNRPPTTPQQNNTKQQMTPPTTPQLNNTQKQNAPQTNSNKDNKDQNIDTKSGNQSIGASKTPNAAAGDAVQRTPLPYYCVHVQSLPPVVELKDVRDFFGGLEIVPRGIQIVYDSNGRPLGEAFVEFVTKTDCEKAVQKDQEVLGNHSIRVKPISKVDMMDYLRQARTSRPPPHPLSRAHMQHAQSPHAPPSANSLFYRGPSRLFYIRAHNLPFTISSREIMNFFQGYNPVEGSIKVQVGSDPKSGGTTATIAFRTKEEADIAIKALTGKFYRHKQISLTPTSVLQLDDSEDE